MTVAESTNQAIAGLDYQVAIASAVEEQTATTKKMNRDVGEAADLGTEIAANISGAATAAQATATRTADSRRAAASPGCPRRCALW